MNWPDGINTGLGLTHLAKYAVAAGDWIGSWGSDGARQ